MSKKTEALEIILGLMPNAKFIDKNGKDVTEDVKKSHNTEENEPKTHKSLTEQWKCRELETGWYYYKRENSKIEIAYQFKVLKYPYDIKGNDIDDVVEVLAPVPSYEEWQELIGKKNWCNARAKNLLEKNQQLKKLLKECNETFFEIRLSLASGKINSVFDLSRQHENDINEVLK